MTETLNLNCPVLVSARWNVLSPLAEKIENIKDSRCRMEMCESLLRYYDSDKAENRYFLGILVYYLKKLLK